LKTETISFQLAIIIANPRPVCVKSGGFKYRTCYLNLAQYCKRCWNCCANWHTVTNLCKL